MATKCLEMFAKISAKNEHYKNFYQEFRKCLTSSFHKVSTNRPKIAELLRFNTSNSGEEQISLKEFVDRMKDGQNDTFYMTGESIELLSSSPFLENCRKEGLEALYMVDPVKNP